MDATSDVGREGVLQGGNVSQNNPHVKADLLPLVVPLGDPLRGADGGEVLEEELAGLVLLSLSSGYGDRLEMRE